MPGLHVDFTEEEYAMIPKPKRRWVKELVQAALGGEDRVVVPDRSDPREFFFRVDGKVVSATGRTPAEAALTLGMDIMPTTQWRTKAEAEKDGWLNEKDPLDV